MLEAAKASGEVPLDFLLSLKRDPQSPIARRLDAAKAAAPFLHQKLSAIDAKLSPAIADPSPKTSSVRVEFIVPGAAHARDDQE
jgi:hypothetical protein